VNPWTSTIPQKLLSVIRGTGFYILDLGYGKIFDTGLVWSYRVTTADIK